ncbi:hypothetical protein LAZ67_21001276 [Cordylochernes scorpioides]|uniref:RNA-directed DNA polymerase n=1 Tax=Cordylochernes scorpioides TaxID=51811 RepID=A0ABY6LM79_9ARAC|nr:hypothetical protein LAZ67_21001276 [Cordylochernes scorpioides]
MDEKNETQNAEEDTAEGENNPAVSTPKIEPPPPSAELPAVLARLAACLSALQTTSDRVTHRTEIEVQSFDGTYPAAQFFRTYDQKTDWDGLTNTEKVLCLQGYLNNKPLEHFRRLRMETQHYIQVRQTFLDLYPETNEATYAQYFSMKLAGQPNLEEYYRNKTALGLQLGLPQEVILETLTEGLPPSDQRLVRIVPPENLGAWFRLVQRIRGSGAPSPRHPDEHAPPLLGPYAPVPPVRIATNSDKVVTIRPYRVPICDQREIRSQIRQMLDNDIIEPSYSPFSSPVTLVTKRDKTKRFCIDYRKVNEVISSDVHPLPRIEDILDRLARAKYFSTADVSSAYWQVPIHPDSRPLLAFATIDGLYQPTRLPFGLKTSPQIYERAINQVLQGHGLDCVAHYFDDFVIYSETLEEHQEHLRKFFAFCDAENLQLNLTKCEFFRQTIEFLGYTITAGTTTPLIRNTDVIHAIPPPNNRKTLQSFLGAVNVYNKFIPDYARLRTPLNNLLKKDVTWDWDDKCQKAFTSLKESLTQHPVLHLYKDELPCQVYCDASTLGIAGVLKQVHSAGKAYPVQYFSRALRVHERNYTISELECLAIVESVEKFRVYLMGRKFTIFSDHHALQWLKTIKNPSGRLFRWSLRLSCYEYEVRYIKGSQQHEADLLSRNPFCGFLDTTLIKNHQLTPSGESKLTIDRNGLQTLKRRGVTKIVVPDALVPDLLTKVHSRYNHPGISQMTRLISPQYYWKGMSEDISKTTKACAICQSTKHPRGPTFGELGQLPVATQPFDLVALDTIAGLAKYGNAKAYLHVVVDHFSRYTWTFPSKSTSITTYQQVIKRVLQDGSPKRLLTDRAPAFTSPKFRKFLINRNIHPLLTTSNNPQANGLCERLNATLTGKLRLLHLENPKAAWTKLAKRVTVVYNNTPHSVTGFPPGYLMFGVLPPELTEHVNPYPVLTTARRIAHERTQAKHLKDKHAYDQQHKTPHFEPGDLVLVKVYHHPNTGKLAPYFTGPYEILEIISPNVVRINRPNQPLNRNTDTVHVNKLQYYNENIRYIAPPTLIPHPAKPQSRTLPPLFEHLTPDLFTVVSLFLILIKKITGCRDISRGKELHPIQCVNGVDLEPPPTDYLYVTENCETSPMNIDRTITSLQFCRCQDDCTTPGCTCATISFKCWFDKDGILLPEFNMLDPPMIFECNRACLCWKSCNNRMIQHGVSLHEFHEFMLLELFYDEQRLLPKVLFSASNASQNVFWSCRAPPEYTPLYQLCLGGILQFLFIFVLATVSISLKDGETYCLDARHYGNISRFINHLCEPNIIPVKVFVDHQDLGFPRIAFFSFRDIKAFEELGFDYGEKFWVIKYKSFTCCCGSAKCKYSRDTIQDTLANYNRRLREEQNEEEASTCIPLS